MDNPVRRSALSVLFSVVFLDNLGFAIVLPYLFFFVQFLGGNTFVYGLLLASYSFMSLVLTPILSRVSDRLGRRRILLVALLVSSFSYFVFGLANALWLLFVARMIAGSTAATVPVAQAYAADVTTKKDRIKYLGLLGAAAGLAFVLGPAIGGTLSKLFGYAVPSFLASGLAFANLVSAYFLLPEPSRAGYDESKSTSMIAGFRDILKEPEIRLLLVIYFMFMFAFVSFQVAVSPWLQAIFGFGAFQTGLLFFYIGSIVVLVQGVLLPRFSKRFSPSTLALSGLIIFSISFALLGFFKSFVLLLVASTLIPVGLGVLLATLSGLISVNVPPEEQGGSLGTAWAVAGLAQTIAPTLATILFAFGLSNGISGLAFLFSASISVTIVPLMLSFKKRYEMSGKQ
jgi:DHA1 family tetracycline resistance protein-like MFS transporter